METPYTTLLIFALVSLIDFTYAVKFKWSTSATLQLGRCVANDTSLGLCAKSINVTCVIKGRGRPIPKYYCRESSISPKPPTLVPCDEKKCRQRCIVSMWSSWNPCDPACVLPFKYRTRRVLLSDGASAVCPALIERSLCAHCSQSAQKEIFFWKVGQWGSCRQFTTITIHQSPVKTRVVATSPQFCAAVLRVGKSTRKVRCADRQGQEVRTRKCLNSKDKYGRITQRPEKSKVCSLPCDCHVSNWSQWSGCTKDCHVTEERRTRDVLYAAQLGGKPCEALEEKRACATQKMCPHYEWYAASWGLCQTRRFPGNSSMNECGHGFQERLVFCIKSSNNNKSISELQPVHDDQCDPRMKHISRKPCHTPCRQDCKVSEWQPWEPCSQGCGQSGGIKRKRRTVLQKASHGGRDCPNLVELSPCQRVQCYSWAVKEWSMCFVNNGTCGLGVHYRFVFCLGYQNKWFKAKYCSHLVKPNVKEPCSNPCPEDCAISYYSEWGPCSKSCGIHGGIQTRYKRILGYPSASGTPCPADEKLVESRKCNSRTFCEHEMNFMWKADPWHMCEPLVKGLCGKFKGIKKRTVHCVTHRQNLGNTSFCPQQLKPAAVNPCDVPCPKNCIVSKWQEWSVCSEMCRSTGVEMRKRFILQEVSHNGTPCPSNMTDGVEIEVRPCTFMPSCYTYRWVASEWEMCILFPQTRSNCGAGYQTRNVSCLRSDETLVEASFCYKGLFTAPPKTLKECWIPCPNYCVRSDWSSWSDCPHNCTTHLPSFRQRTRQVVNLSPARGGWSTTCPQLTPLDFSEKEECPTIFCFSYKWYTGTWGSCVLNEIYCGNGKEERAVLCQRSDKLFVSETYCNNVTKPNSLQSCSVSCSQDCIVSTWGKWTNCSHTCGDSIEKRHRTIVTSSVGFGRLCPNLIEKRLCHEMPCSSFKWSDELWSTCKLNTNSTCGNGTQTRKIICLPDPARESVCMKQAPKPATTQPCELPCPGDCVLSNWGSWSTCVKGRNGCIRIRWRISVRAASLTSLKKCNESSSNEQRESCDCSSAGTLVPTEWSTCQLNHTSGPNCGKGQQFRSEKCTGEKGQILSDEYCTGKNKIFMMQDCYVKCPVDCILGKWSPWSLCPITCGADGTVMRSRKIIVVGMYGGRICPDKSSLKQKRPCNVKPCYTYTLKKGKWSKCYVDGQGCGYGTQTKQAWCERSDGKLVNLYYCFEHLNRSADTKDLNVLQAVLNNISTLSVSTKQKCEVTCPGDCISHEWSEWSICGRSCFLNASHSTFQTRTRLIIANAITGGKACATDLQQTQACQPDGNTKCIGAKWKIGPWQKNGTRRVWCETSNGLSISEACVFNKPSTTKLCEPKCPDPNAVCTDGKCVCKPLFESFQSQCIPINGCLHNGHCIFKNTTCKEQECKCREEHKRNTTTGPCVWVPGTSTSTNIEITTSSPTVTSTVSDGGNKKTFSETNETIPIGYWKWIGIGGGALLFMILLAVGVLCYLRMQNKTKKKHDKKSANSIELIGMLSIPDGENGKPEKV